MTPEQIKTLIDQKIAGQGTMVDVGGALPTILKEIVDMAESASTPKLIELSGLPTASMTTQAALDAIGITEAELTAAANGERLGAHHNTGVVDQFYSIQYVAGPSIAGYAIVLMGITSKYTIQSMLGTITVTVTTLS